MLSKDGLGEFSWAQVTFYVDSEQGQRRCYRDFLARASDCHCGGVDIRASMISLFFIA